MFVVIQTGGKQISVSYNQEIFIEKITGNAKDKVIFDKILMLDQKFGKPFLKGAEVHGEILKQDKAKKIKVFKYKPKKNSKTMYGHRQPYTKVLITDILFEGKSIIDKSKLVTPEIKPVVIAENKEEVTKEVKPVVTLENKKEVTKKVVAKAPKSTPVKKTTKSATASKTKTAVNDKTDK